MQVLPSQNISTNYGEIVGFSENYNIEELSFQEDVIMNISDINQRIIEKIVTSRIKIATITKTIAKATTRKRKKFHFDLHYLETGPVSEEYIGERLRISVAQATLILKETTRRLIRYRTLSPSIWE